MRACGLHRVCTRLKKNQNSRVILACLWFAQGSKKSKQQSRSMMFRVILCIQFYRLTQLLLSTLLKGIIRKECQSFTNHGHDKTPPTVFNPLSLWLTLPRDMVSATHNGLPALPEPFLRACGLHRVCTRLKKIKTAEPFYDVQGDSMCSILSIGATCFSTLLSGMT